MLSAHRRRDMLSDVCFRGGFERRPGRRRFGVPPKTWHMLSANCSGHMLLVKNLIRLRLQNRYHSIEFVEESKSTPECACS